MNDNLDRAVRASQYFYDHENDSQRRLEEIRADIATLQEHGKSLTYGVQALNAAEQELILVADEHRMNVAHSNAFAAGARDALHEAALEDARRQVETAYQQASYDI